MKRRTVHLAFVLASLALAVPVATQAWRLQQAGRINAAIASADGRRETMASLGAIERALAAAQ